MPDWRGPSGYTSASVCPSSSSKPFIKPFLATGITPTRSAYMQGKEGGIISYIAQTISPVVLVYTHSVNICIPLQLKTMAAHTIASVQ